MYVYKNICNVWMFLTLSSIGSLGGDQRTVVFVKTTGDLDEALTYCKSLNGTLASTIVLEKLGDKLSKCHQSSDSTTYWTGNVTVVTPYISLVACVESSYGKNKAEFSIEENSVEKCASLCDSHAAFKIQENRCSCQNGNVPITTVDAQRCNIFCKDSEQYCGGKNVSNYYKFFTDHVESAGSEDNCAFATCSTLCNGSFCLFKSPCESESAINSKLVCDTSSTPTVGNVSKWMDAVSKCVFHSSGYPISALSQGDCETLCPNSNQPLNTQICGSVWTSTRKYEGNVLIKNEDVTVNEQRCSVGITTAGPTTISTATSTSTSAFGNVESLISASVAVALVVGSIVFGLIFVCSRRGTPQSDSNESQENERKLRNTRGHSKIIQTDESEGQYDISCHVGVKKTEITNICRGKYTEDKEGHYDVSKYGGENRERYLTEESGGYYDLSEQSDTYRGNSIDEHIGHYDVTNYVGKHRGRNAIETEGLYDVSTNSGAYTEKAIDEEVTHYDV